MNTVNLLQPGERRRNLDKLKNKLILSQLMSPLTHYLTLTSPTCAPFTLTLHPWLTLIPLMPHPTLHPPQSLAHSQLIHTHCSLPHALTTTDTMPHKN